MTTGSKQRKVGSGSRTLRGALHPNFEEHVQKKYREHMKHWLDYAFENYLRIRYRRPQTELLRTTGAKSAAGGNGQKGRTVQDMTRGPNSKKSSTAWFNNWLLYHDWRKQIQIEAGPLRIFVQYHEAVPELHALLDYIAEQEKD